MRKAIFVLFWWFAIFGTARPIEQIGPFVRLVDCEKIRAEALKYYKMGNVTSCFEGGSRG